MDEEKLSPLDLLADAIRPQWVPHPDSFNEVDDRWVNGSEEFKESWRKEARRILAKMSVNGPVVIEDGMISPLNKETEDDPPIDLSYNLI